MFDRIKSILIKEFIQIVRDPKIRVVLVAMPLFQIIVFGNAVSTDVDNVLTAVYDLDNTKESRDLIREFTYSGYFEIKENIKEEGRIKYLIDNSIVQVVIRINRRFAEDFNAGKTAQVQIIVDGTDSNTAGIILSYVNQVIERYTARLLNQKLELVILNDRGSIPGIELRSRAWFNENLISRRFFVPGITALILLILTILLTAMAIVREKEVGTIEQLIVSPIRPYELILGKLLPFAVVGLLVAFLTTVLGVIAFKVPVRGSLFLLFVSSCLYLLTTLGVGLFISTRSKTQMEAMMSTFFFAQPAVLLSGFVFPIDSMPKIVQYLTYLNPLRYYLVIIRGIFLKGIGMDILWPQMLALLIIGLAVITLSTLSFHKNLG